MASAATAPPTGCRRESVYDEDRHGILSLVSPFRAAARFVSAQTGVAPMIADTNQAAGICVSTNVAITDCR